MTEQQSDFSGFIGLGIAPTLLELLAKEKYTNPTPIQAKAIPVAIEGKDVIGIAQTGTGKTLAFGIPMIQRLAMFKGRGLVILPTRELAIQVDESLKRFGTPLKMRTAVLIGGENIGKQIRQLKANPHVIICTPGRLIDHLEQKTIQLDDIKVLVLDEADRMLDMGFAPQINRILGLVPKARQTLLFSATMPQDIVKIAKNHMQLPLSVEVAPAGTASERVAQELIIVRKESKLGMLAQELNNFKGTVLVFSRTKHGAKKMTHALRDMGHTAAEIHANRTLSQRREALNGFKSGKYRVLVATDIAARGIDVKGIGLVVNYDLPDNAEDYVHRIGRTGRAGHEGKAISFATPDQGADIRAIERLIRGKLPLRAGQSAPLQEAAAPLQRNSRQGGNRPSPRNTRGGYAPRGGRGQSQGRPTHPRSAHARPVSQSRPAQTSGDRRAAISDDEDAPAYRYGGR